MILNVIFHGRSRATSLRRTGRISQRSADSALGMSDCYTRSSYSDTECRWFKRKLVDSLEYDFICQFVILKSYFFPPGTTTKWIENWPCSAGACPWKPQTDTRSRGLPDIPTRCLCAGTRQPSNPGRPVKTVVSEIMSIITKADTGWQVSISVGIYRYKYSLVFIFVLINRGKSCKLYYLW